MTFKCHKVERRDTSSTTGGTTTIFYPVHSLGFNIRAPKFLFTAGGEGCISYWDYEKKNKIKTFNYKGIPITRAKVSPDGNYLAYALGYDWSKGIWGWDPIAQANKKICIHYIPDSELRGS